MKIFFLTLFFATQVLASDLHIYGAASLTDILQEVAKAQTQSKVKFNFDASSKLARQIESGAPADLFFSADTEWMDYLAGKNKIDPSSRQNLLKNRLVMIVPKDSTLKDLRSKELKHLALAGEAVPAGKFARAALKSENVWDDTLAKKVVNADNVRIALKWVASHEAEAGIVYATDAQIEKSVKVAYVYPQSSHPEILNPVAIISGSKNAKEAKAFIEFCRSEKAQAIFRKAGFQTL